MKKIYLDSFVYSHIAKDQTFADQVRNFIHNSDMTLVVSTTNLIELYPNQKRWKESTDFIVSVPFMIASNPDEIVDREVSAYPKEIELPFKLKSEDLNFSKETIAEAIRVNLSTKISKMQSNFQKESEQTFSTLCKTRDAKNSAFATTSEIDCYLMTNVINLLMHSHNRFLNYELAKGNELHWKVFKVYSVQLAAILFDYFIQQKSGQSSDAGDFLQLGYAPYVNLAVFDNGKVDTLRRIQKQNALSFSINCINLTTFRQWVSA